MGSQFSRYNFLVIDLFIVVAREQRRKNTKWRSMLVQGQTNMTDIVKDWQTKRLFKYLKEASSNWKKRAYGEKEILNSQRSAGRTNKTNMTDIGKDWQSGEIRFSQEKIPTLDDLRDHQKTPNCQNNKIVLGKLRDLKIYLQI